MTRTLYATSILGAVVFALVFQSTASQAAGTHEQRRACRADAMRLCREYVPNVERISACMRRNLKKLSPLCRSQFK